jgi:Domain of unknown function (DUF4430)
VYRRFLAVVAALAAAAALAPAALAVLVHVRVEGKTETIFGATKPTLQVKDTPLDALEAASLAGEFYYHLTQSSLGPYVDQIGRYPAGGSDGWIFKVNGIVSQIGASAVHLRAGDTVLWYWAAFSGPAGPLTLEVENSIVRGKQCFFATGRNDAGHASRVGNVVFTLNGRRLRSRSGVVCTGRGRYAVRVAKPGTVRSRLYIGR